ncbi:Acyl-coenzyme A thioesterase 13 [Linum perenne]
MDLESVRRFLEKGSGIDKDAGEDKNGSSIEAIPFRFFERFIMQGLQVDLVEPGRVICSMKVPPRLLNAGNFLHGGATATLVDLVGSAVIFTVGAPQTGVSVEINVSYLDAAYVNTGRDRNRSQDSASWEGCWSRQCRVEEEEDWETYSAGPSYQVSCCL